MKKIFLFILFFVLHFSAKTQNVNLLDNCNTIQGFKKYTLLKSFEELPVKIQQIVKQLLKERIGLSTTTAFEKGIEYDIDRLFKDISISAQTGMEQVIPKYEIVYQVFITKLQATPICVNIKLDAYGQVLNMDWPVRGYIADDFVYNYELIKTKALKYAMAEDFEIKDLLSKLVYNPNYGAICYEFRFREKNNTLKETQSIKWRVLLLDVRTGKLINTDIEYEEHRNIKTF